MLAEITSLVGGLNLKPVKDSENTDAVGPLVNSVLPVIDL